jgi:hypothetical protein
MSTPTFTSVFWHEPIAPTDAASFGGVFEVGEVPDPDKLVAAGWWISADGLTLTPPGSTPPVGAEGYLPEG